MKSLVLGIMIISVSMSFAQGDENPTHQVKNQFIEMKMMKVEPAVMNVLKDAAADDNSNEIILSNEDVDSRVIQGVIRLEKGTPYIIVNSERKERTLMPVNLSKSMAVNDQVIQFAYAVSDVKKLNNFEEVTVVRVYDVSKLPKR